MRTQDHTAPGPVTLELACTIGAIEIECDAGHDTARIELVPNDPTEELAASVIARSEITSDGDRLTVRIPWPHKISMVTRSHGGASVSNTFIGNVTGGGRVYQSTGDIHIGGRSSATEQTAGIVVRAYLPALSSLDVGTTTANVRATGCYEKAVIDSDTGNINLTAVLDEAVLRSNTGGVSISAAESVKASSTTGDISIGGAKRVTARSDTGDIRVLQVEERATLKTTTGDVSVAATGAVQVKARTTTGDVRATGPFIELDAKSTTGRVRRS